MDQKYKCDKKYAYKVFQNLFSLMLSVLTEIWRTQMSFLKRNSLALLSQWVLQLKHAV
jgi:hypothetical protein